METPPPLPPAGLRPTIPSRRTSGLAVASLVLGIVSVIGGALLLLVPPILAVIFGHNALAKCKNDPALAGRGMGIAGLAMGYASFALFGLGLFAAMSIPAFERVRTASQDKAVLNNARQLAAAADQHYLDAGVSRARFDQLVGPTNYIPTLHIIAGERYPAHYTQGVTMTITGVAGARTITYAP